MRKTIVALRARRGREQLRDIEGTVRLACEAASSAGIERLAVDLPADEVSVRSIRASTAAAA